MKKIISLLVLVLLVSMLAVTAFADDAAPTGYTYLYDCSRSISYPSAGQTVKVNGFQNPLPANGGTRLEATTWTATYLGVFSSLTDADAKDRVDKTVEEMGKTNVKIYSISNGTETIVAALIAESNDGWLLVRDNAASEGWTGGAGYFLTNAVRTDEISIEITEAPKEETSKEDPKPEVKPDPCDHKFDENGKCSRCGIIVISYEDGKPAVEAETEANPNTGAESAFGVFAAIAVVSLAAVAVTGKK